MSSEPAPELGVLFDVLRANEAVGAMLRDALTGTGLTPTGYAVLSLVATLGTTTPSEVAARIGAKPSTLTAHLAGLETDGLISRRRGADGRSADLQITEQGRRAHGDAHRRVELVWRSVSSELDVPELRAVLARLITSLTERARPLR
ncbi:MarR family winged helix-turn-helix transcriptional regulator [Microbacterium sp.]|uniref:MarR family winged helix-turn-helix transcriptional regulator n=1 Tax=Microbacterium sp. TaxID=51671 RepID=UPI003A8D4DA2